MRELSSYEIDLVAGGAAAWSSATGVAVLGAVSVHTNAQAAQGFFFFSEASTSGSARAIGLLVAANSTSVAIS